MNRRVNSEYRQEERGKEKKYQMINQERKKKLNLMIRQKQK